jgi:multiple sugar transport system ATP-binding protein
MRARVYCDFLTVTRVFEKIDAAFRGGLLPALNVSAFPDKVLDDPWFPKFASLNVLTDLTPLLQKRGLRSSLTTILWPHRSPFVGILSRPARSTRCHMSATRSCFSTAIGYPLRVRKLGREQISRQVQQTAAMLEIEPLLARKPRELSGGERQRVALARAIVRQPRAFLMDEPLSNLDARLRLQMRGELKHLQHELGITTVYVTHDQAEAMTLGHRVAVMKRGKLQQFDTPLNIYNHPANRFVAEFVGSPSMNSVDGEVDVKARTFTAEGIELTLSGGQIEQLSRLNPDRRVTLGIRPEDIQVSTNKRDGWVPLSVYVTELMGSETFVFLKLGGERIVARAPGDFRAETDSTVWIEMDTERAHLFDPGSSQRL